MSQDLYNLLVKHLPPEEAVAIHPKWYSTSIVESTELWNQAWREADIVVMEATLVASEGLVDGEIHCITDPKIELTPKSWTLFRRLLVQNRGSEYAPEATAPRIQPG